MKKIIFILFVICGFYFMVSFGQSVENKVTVVIAGEGIIIGTPSNILIGTIAGGNTEVKTFQDYFWLEDLRGSNAGHYTTIQCDGLYGPSGATSTVITGVQLSGAVVEKIGGRDNDTLVYSALDTFTDITSPQLYLYRNDSISNLGVNRYGNKPSIKITIPLGTPPGTYKGKITYTLYDMPFSY